MSGDWFHASRDTIRRSAGRSVVAAAAYRTASSIECEREGITHDYTRKGGVKEVFVTTPEGKDGLEWAQDISALTNAMEAAEKRKDGQVGHEWEIALPSVLSDEQRSDLSRELAQQLSDLYGVAAIGAIHAPGREGDIRNEHLHLLFTTREVEAEGQLGAKVTVLTDKKTAGAETTRYRHIVADSINAALEDAGFDDSEFVDARRFRERGIDRAATEHMGPAATNQERRSRESSRRADINKDIIEARIAEQERLADALARQLDDAPPAHLTLEAERDLARRFGEEWREDDRLPESALRMEASDGGLPWHEEHHAGGPQESMQAEIDRLEHTGTTLPRPSLLARVQAAAEAFGGYVREVGEAVHSVVSSWVARVSGRHPEPVHAEPEGIGGDPSGPAGDVEPSGPEAEPRQGGFRAIVEAWAEHWENAGDAAEEAEMMSYEDYSAPDMPPAPEPPTEPEPDLDPDDAPDFW